MRERIAWLLTIRSLDEDERRRGTMVLAISLGLILTSLLLLPVALGGNGITGRVIVIGSMAAFAGAFFLVRYGRVTLGAFTLITVTLFGSFSPLLTSRNVSFAIFYLALSLLIASLTLRPWQIWLVLLAIMAGLGIYVRTLPPGVLAERANANMLVGGVLFLGVVSLISFLGASNMSRILRNMLQARSEVEATAAVLARTNAELEQRIGERTAELQVALDEVQARAEEQARLLAENDQQRATIREMSVPIIPVSDTTMIIPLIGTLDSKRLIELYNQALHAIERNGTRYLILDITGVVMVDTQVAQGIMIVVQSARLLGAEAILVGIRPEVAQAVVQLGVNLAGMRTFSTLQTALSHLAVQVLEHR